MKTATILIVAVVMVSVFWIRSMPVAQKEATLIAPEVGYNREHLSTAPALKKYRYKQLQLYPIVASQAFLDFHSRLGPYLSLRKALAEGKILITEVEGTPQPTAHDNQAQQPIQQHDGARVNALFVENVSSDTILILGGEVVRGGKQDRMIAQDFMVIPNNGKIDVAVYCVEHGRWTANEQKAAFMDVMDVAPNKVRKAAKAPAAQQKVWEEVEDIHAQVDLKVTTGALAHAMEAKSMDDFGGPYKEYFTRIEWPGDVVGMVAVMEGEIVGCDVFAQPVLFREYFQSLLSSYLGSPFGGGNGKKASQANVVKYLEELFANEGQLDARVAEGGTQLRNGKFRIHVAVYSSTKKEPPAYVPRPGGYDTC